MATYESWATSGGLIESWVNTPSDSTSGFYIPPDGAKFLIVCAQGSGGGGGGGDYESSSYNAGGGGGGGGGYMRDFLIPCADLASIAYTMGAGGAGGAQNDWGVTGGDASMGTFFSCLGGVRGDHGRSTSSSDTAGFYGSGSGTIFGETTTPGLVPTLFGVIAGSRGGTGGADSTNTFPIDGLANTTHAAGVAVGTAEDDGGGGGASANGAGGSGSARATLPTTPTGFGGGGGGGNGLIGYPYDGAAGADGFLWVRAYG